MTMNQSHKRAFLSLRQQVHFYLKSSSPISRFSNPNPNSRSFSSWTSYVPRDRQTRLLGARCLFSCNSSPLISNWSFRSGFNGVRSFATRLAESNNRPPKETILLEGCDFEHWLVVVDNPDPQLTRDEIIDGYIKTLSQIVGSEEEARMKIYSVSTRHYFAFGALVSEELAYKLKELPHVRWVLPDSYLDVKNKTYAGEPFINGQAVPYDPKYHEIWVRNHEQSLKNNMKNKRKQRDPNSSRLRQRSPPSSAPSNSNENWMSATGTQNQASQTSTMQDHTLSSSSNHDVPSHNRMPPPKQALSPDQMSKPSPASSFQRQAPHSTQMQNYSMPSTPPPPQSYCQNQGNQNQNLTPITGSQNLAWQPSQMQKQTPLPSVTSKPYTPIWSGQNQSPEPGSRYRSQPAEPLISNNDYLYNNLPPSSSESNMPSQMLNSDFQGVGIPPRVQQNNHYRNIPHHVHNSVLQDGCPPEPLKHQPYQNDYRDMQNLNAMVSPRFDRNYQNVNMTPSAPAWDMPSHMNPGYVHQQNGYDNRGFSGDVQNGNSDKGHLSTVPQLQQYQNSNVDLQSSNATVCPQGALNCQNTNMAPSAPPRDIPSQMQKPDIHRRCTRSPVKPNGDSHSGCYPSHTSPCQQHQSMSRDFQNLNAMGSPQIGNYPKMTASMQNNSFPNANMIPHVQNQFQGADMPKPMQDFKYQHDMKRATKQVDNCSGGALPGCSDHGTVQTRDYQSRDVLSDEEYVYASNDLKFSLPLDGRHETSDDLIVE